jgi:thiol-disulfide isomerase/thioredoxin
MFICNHCPYVIHLAPALAELGRSYDDKTVAIVAISSNDVDNYPADSPEKMAAEKSARGYTFPYLYDESQAVAKAYRAACTPDFFVFDSERALAYAGRFDETRPFRISSGNYDSTRDPAHGADLRAAIDAILTGGRPTSDQHPSMGCNIKWKPGNAPNYFG